MIHIIAIITAINAFMMSLITLSYLVAYRLSKTRHILALFCFFLMAAVVTGQSLFQIIRFILSHRPLPEGSNLMLSLVISLAVSAATGFLLVSTWWPLFKTKIAPKV